MKLKEIEQQIEKAFHYRGNVTVKFKDGHEVDGYLYNREFSNTKLAEDNFIEVFPVGDPGFKRFSIENIDSVQLSGPEAV